MLGDARYAREKLGWEPKVSFEALVQEMTAADLEDAEKVKHIRDGGYDVPKRRE